MSSRTDLNSHYLLKAIYAFLVTAVVMLIVIMATPQWRDKIRGLFRPVERRIVATLRDDLKNQGQPVLVFKIKEGESLFLEFYESDADKIIETSTSSMNLIQRLELPNSIDGFVTFMGEATNLAVANLDADELLELVVPTYNLEFAPILEVVKFNPGNGRFELLQSFDVPSSFLQGFQKESQ
ncbi:MAG: hypothetical protein RJB66_2248 [Pseudomonadota bacterium]|jgi:hypothetical protein